MLRSILLTAASLAIAAPAQAAIWNFQTPLFGAEEVPPVITPATGLARIQFDSAADTLWLRVVVRDLVGGLADGHFHQAPFGANGPVIVGFPALPLGETSFRYVQTLDLAKTATYRPAFLMANGGTAAGARDALIGLLGNGGIYVNIHSTFRPGGEIRGQVEVPAPAALALFGLGLAGVAMARRRPA